MSAYKFSDDDTKNANTYRNSVTGTPHYLAPEIGDLECDEFNQQVYDDKIDSWAFGITLFEISNFSLLLDKNDLILTIKISNSLIKYLGSKDLLLFYLYFFKISSTTSCE